MWLLDQHRNVCLKLKENTMNMVKENTFPCRKLYFANLEIFINEPHNTGKFYQKLGGKHRVDTAFSRKLSDVFFISIHVLLI